MKTYHTERRDAVLRYLVEHREESFTLEEICDAVLSDGSGRSTVYRLVHRLCEEQLVRRIPDGNSRHITYQYMGDSHCAGHLHLKCTGCGRLIHLDDSTSRLVTEGILRARHFTLDGGTLLFGTCAACGKKGHI